MLNRIMNKIENWIYFRKLSLRLRYRGGYLEQQAMGGIWMSIITGLETGADLK